MRARLAFFSCLILALVAAITPTFGHEGHNHSDAPPAATASSPRGEAHGEEFEVVAILRNGSLLIYVDRFATNEPVTGARIEVETPKGLLVAEPEQSGFYRLPAPWAKGGDHYDVIVIVTDVDKVDVLPVTITGTQPNEVTSAQGLSIWTAAAFALLTALAAFAAGVFAMRRYPNRFPKRMLGALALLLALFVSPAQSHDGHSHDDKRALSARDVPQRLPDGSLFIPKPVQRILSIRTAIVKSSEHSKTVELPGRIIPDANASGYVQSSLAGRLLPPPNGFPALGSRVEKGQVLAYVEPPIQTIDVSDMRQKEGELLQQIAIVERRVMRFEKLVESNAVPRTQLEDARTELESLRERKAQLDKIRREPEVLIAPVSGVIAEANTIAGQLAQPSTVVFQIVDPSKLWIEALSFDAIPKVERASARTNSGKSVDLLFRGSAAALRNQAIAVHFAVSGKADGIWVGQFVTVYASLPDKRRGILLPRAAVVRTANGQHVVFEHVSAERFEIREVKAEALDADNVLVTAGIEDGKRVVVQGAELLDQVR